MFKKVTIKWDNGEIESFKVWEGCLEWTKDGFFVNDGGSRKFFNHSYIRRIEVADQV